MGKWGKSVGEKSDSNPRDSTHMCLRLPNNMDRVDYLSWWNLGSNSGSARGCHTKIAISAKFSIKTGCQRKFLRFRPKTSQESVSRDPKNLFRPSCSFVLDRKPDQTEAMCKKWSHLGKSVILSLSGRKKNFCKIFDPTATFCGPVGTLYQKSSAKFGGPIINFELPGIFFLLLVTFC